MLKTDNPDRLFAVVLVSTVVIKLIAAQLLPLTGDEAYFIVWGKHLDYGYYDHTPMVGWVLAALLAVGDAVVWLRLPSILISTFIGWSIWRLLRDSNREIAAFAAALYLLAPVNLLGVIITTDTPLILFGFLSGLCFFRAQDGDRPLWYALSGLFLGLAFFSKFFAGLLGIAYVLYVVLFVRRGPKPYLGLALVVLGTLPFIGLNLIWNYNNCWNNYLFNLLNRTQGAALSLKTPGKYAFWLLYLATPPLLYYLLREWRRFVPAMRLGGTGVFLALFLIPIALFALLSGWKSIGLHWLFSFYPFLFIGAAALLDAPRLRRTLKFMVWFSLVHGVVFVSLAIVVEYSPQLLRALPDPFKVAESPYKDVIYATRNEEILAALDKYRDDFKLATDSYRESADLYYTSREHVMVFGGGSYHARQDDLLTDFRELDGGNILILAYFPGIERFGEYFDSAELKTLEMEGVQFYYVLGRGFRYEKYQRDVLDGIIRNYYSIPDFLPVSTCYMHERYGVPAQRDGR
ncbi:MAG: glycosyltransferase family 39 protein [Pseudomonadota bacterium]|nr:MAG: glycosyltransferase family 39 protein [Pseudomonadota bacterium]